MEIFLFAQNVDQPEGFGMKNFPTWSCGMKNMGCLKALMYLLEKKPKKYYLKNEMLWERGFIFDKFVCFVNWMWWLNEKNIKQ